MTILYLLLVCFQGLPPLFLHTQVFDLAVIVADEVAFHREEVEVVFYRDEVDEEVPHDEVADEEEEVAGNHFLSS